MERGGKNILSLFDGKSGAQIALNKRGIKYTNYYASEIDKSAIKVTQDNYPDTIQLGDVRTISAKDLPTIDFLFGGSPCQGFSFAGNQLNFDDPRSKLFFEFVRILNEIREFNPDVIFLLENVPMAKEHEVIITKSLGIEPIYIDSSLLSAQGRERVYWTNINSIQYNLFGDYIANIPQPKEKGIMLNDILENEVDEKYWIEEEKTLAILNNEVSEGKIISLGKDSKGKHVYSIHGKHVTIGRDNKIIKGGGGIYSDV